MPPCMIGTWGYGSGYNGAKMIFGTSYSEEQLWDTFETAYELGFTMWVGVKLEQLDCLVLTDEKWMVFVIEQLLSNAIKYTPAGEIGIFADRQELDGIRRTRLFIQDTGVGIYPEDLPRIFERSFTGYNGRMDKKASGLGLYLCDTVLKQLGHSISIDSVPKEGTTVTIVFTENLNY